MTARHDVERVVGAWLRESTGSDDAGTANADRILGGIRGRVAATDQDRYLSQRLLGNELGRSRQVRVALAVALVGLLTLSAFAAGSLLRDALLEPRASNGWIAFDAIGTAGADLSGTNLDRNGHGDIYVVREGMPPRRIVGADDDPLHQMCPTFSPDGSRLAFIQLDMRSVQPMPAPRPDDRSGPEPTRPRAGDPSVGPILWSVGMVGVRPDGSAAEGMTQVPAESTLASCAEWSPDGRRIAYLAWLPDEQLALWVITADGAPARLGPAVDPVNAENYRAAGLAFAWSPDGSTIALLDDEQLHLVPIDGGASRSIPGAGFHTVAWSPDGSRLALGVGSDIRVLGSDGSSVGTILRPESAQGPAPFAWSPDGRRIASLEDDDLVVVDPDGGNRTGTATGIGHLFAPTADGFAARPSQLVWSPDGRRLLVVVEGPDLPGSIVSISADGSEPVVVLVPPKLALRGSWATWQAVPSGSR